MTKSVCIVGAGPSGLVAAKTLLHDAPPGSFNVTVYDAQSRIGGLWPTHRDDNGGLVHPLMVANQSRHTVQFSDLAWQDSAPQFPKAWQVGEYLERYAKQYEGADIRLGHSVVATQLRNDGTWEVRTESEKGTETSVFDHLLVGTGFFGKPLWPDDIPKEGEVPIIHSSKYRDLKTLLSRSKSPGGKILVVGGQMSGIEIAATIATHLSSVVNSPGTKAVPDPEKYSIHHVIQRPSWVFPLFSTPKPDSLTPPFLPCDLPSYNLANRPKPLTNTQGHISVETARLFNSIYQSVLGTDQSDFSPETTLKGTILDEQPFLAMSSYYMDFVRSGLISINQGKLSSLSGTTATLSPNNENVTDIAAVVLATGFDPTPSISFLPLTILSTLSHSPAHPNLPLALAFHGTHHPSLPTLGFVGFYRSPYWGVMEMQARLLAHLWSVPEPGAPLKEKLAGDESISRTLALRSDPRTSQFPMGDYAFLMQDFASALGLAISEPRGDTPPLANGKGMDILTPARYVPSGASETQRAQAERNLTSTYETALAGLGGTKFVAQAVFRSLLGEWKLERDLVSKFPSHPSGKFVGSARFLLREGTADGRGGGGGGDDDEDGKGKKDWGLEYLYIEDGNFTAANGMSFRATRRYVWRYDEASDKLGVWFARTDDAMRADYLFHEVEFLGPGGGDGDGDRDGWAEKGGKRNKGWLAKASHLCVEDLYDVHYEFAFKAVNLRDWRLAYTVKGPKKDYIIDGVYRR